MNDAERSIMNHGVIEKISIPASFKAMEIPQEENLNHYFEYQIEGSSALMCYEETDSPLSLEDREALRKLFGEELSVENPSRRLKLGFNQDGTALNQEDMNAYVALCQCFVFGGRLVRGGSCLDEQKSSWETRRVGSGDK